VKLGWRTDNPATATDAIPQIGDGHHTWTDDEIQKFRDHHPLGTNARLVIELALNTAARRCNLATLEVSQIKDGAIRVAHAKGNEETIVPLTEEARAAIDAMAVKHPRFLILNAYGNPYTVAGLGMRMRGWANDAGLPGCTLHGLRKAQARRLAESGATNAEGRAVTGHKTDAMFSYYSAKANRKRLADSAFAKLKEG
jgi:integrase